MKTEIFNYNGNPVTFKLENGEVMVSATEMSKPFGKKASDWLRLKQTKEYITALMSESGISDSSDLVRVIYGDDGGTLMHEDVAMEFARWLSPKFAIWCNDKIRGLLKTGVATVWSEKGREFIHKQVKKARQCGN